MKREYLTELGISAEIIDKVMGENGKDIEREKGKYTQLESSLETANQTIENMKNTVKKFDGVDIDGMKKQVTDWETKYNTDTSNIKRDNAVEMELLKSGAKNSKAIKALLDNDIIKLDTNGLLGLSEQLDRLKESDSYLFNIGEQPTPAVVINSGVEHTNKNTQLDGLDAAWQQLNPNL